MPDRREFFDCLYMICEGRIEMRAIKIGQRERSFVELIEHSRIDKFCIRYRDWNVYFGVGTRDTSGGGCKENVVNVPALWTDIDFKDIEKNEVKKRLDTFLYKPTAAIMTGHGVHFYWFLKEPAVNGDMEHIEDLLRRIAHHFNGDMTACELARVLRVPGTLNVKVNPVPVTIRFLNGFRYNINDFDELPTVKTKSRNATGKSTNPPGWMVEAFKGVQERGNEHFNGRDSAGIKLAGYWIERLKQEEVYQLLQCWNIRNTPPLDDADLKRIVFSARRYVYNGEPKSGKRISIHFR
jgi:hypothetical protein